MDECGSHMDLALIGGGLEGLLVLWLNYEAVLPFATQLQSKQVSFSNVIEAWNSMRVILCEL